MKKHLPSLADYETLAEGHFTWEVKDWSTLPKRLTGPVFEVGDTPWYALPHLPAPLPSDKTLSNQLLQENIILPPR